MNHILKLLIILIVIIITPLFAQEKLDIKNVSEVKIDSIVISGNEITEEFIIIRELTFSIGDIVNTKKLEFNEERVYSLGLFNFVDFYIQKEDSSNVLLIDVEESWYIFPVPFFNYRENSFSKSNYGINLKWKNFRGRNELLKTILSFGYDPSFVISYYNPVFIEKNDISIKLDLSYTNFSNKSITAEYLYGESFSYQNFQSLITVGKRINNFHEIYSLIGYRYIEAPSRLIESITATNERVDNYPFGGLAYSFDSRNLSQFASNGILGSVTYIHNGFGVKGISFNTINLDYRHYKKIVGRLNSKWRINYRHTFGKNNPYYNISNLGGSEFVRGHRSDDRDGDNYILSSIEFNYALLNDFDISLDLPIIPKKLTSTRISIYLSTFGDTGITYNNGDKIIANNFYSGYGFGITILFLPYNAFRIEYAFDEYKNGELLIGTGFSF